MQLQFICRMMTFSNMCAIYIARELTQYVRPRLNEPGFNAQVKTIRFRTTYMLVGFYLTIQLTKHGLWHTNVIKASKSVR